MSEKKLKILMVEDDRAHVRLAERAFKRSNLKPEVMHVTSGTETLKRLRADHFDVVLLDCYLPGEDGLEVLQHIKAQNPSLPVIIVTGRGDERIAVNAMKLGASDYLVKTTALDHFDLMLVAVQKTLDNQRMKGKIDELERQYQSIAENVNDIIYRYVTDYTIIYISPSVTKVLGYSPDELLNTSYLNLLSDHPMNLIYTDMYEEQMQGVEVKPFVYEVVSKSGDRVQLETHERVFTTDSGEILPMLGMASRIGIQGIARDVTNRRRLEQQVLHSAKLAVIGQMASHVAHEVRNPLSSVQLNLQLLADEAQSYPHTDMQEVNELVTAIHSEVERMGQILDEYLRYARLPQLYLQPGNLNTILENLCHFLAPEIEKARVTLHLDLDPNLPDAHIDEEQLKIVGINLFRNALEAMPEGGELRISTRHTTEYIELRVSDTGIGIDKQQLDAIFQPFYSTKPGGTGLGLPYAQEIIHAHGGHISCESAPGKGTNFTVVIPLDNSAGY